MTRIKICGVTLADDAARIASRGADFIGLNFWPKSKRYLAPERALMIASVARSTGNPKLVGVFVDPEIDEIQAIIATVDLDIIQLHGDETPDFVKKVSLAVYRPVWKAIPIKSSRDLASLDVWPAEALLLDAPTPGRGGAGATFDWQLAREARERFPKINFVLAGGLTPENVTTAIQTVQPWAVDVASGVEAGPGIKDPAKLDVFIGAARLAG
ncbi:MAG TPA: phosphoribosylanthranilate isomerase [Kofleriaceae bacterium]|nr:phosphoribosylanthranilate isomerase [Kofleriaceae bacterium]